MVALSTMNAFRKHCLKTLNGSIPAAIALCKRVGVQGDIATKLASVQGDSYVQVLLTALKAVSLEEFDDAVRYSAPTPSFTRLRFDLTVSAIEALADEVINRSKQIEDSVANIPSGKHTFENTVLALANQEMLLAPIISSVDFLQNVHAEKEIRDASVSADKKITSYSVESGMRKDVFDSLLSYWNLVKSSGFSLDPESKRLLDRYIRDFRRNGLELDEATRDKVRKIQQEVADLQIQFQRNIGEEDTKIMFKAEQLEGMSKDFISKLTPVSDKPGSYYLSLKYPEYIPVMKMCKIEETRRKLEFAYNRRCIQKNVPILERLCTLRHEKANLLGYPDHASYILDIRMAKSPAIVKKFLEELNEQLEPLATQELSELIELKKEEKAARNEPFDGKINQWDFSYYLNQREKLKYDIDHEALTSFFPLSFVLKGMFDIYQQLLSLKFSQVSDAPSWHEDVTMYSVHDLKTDALVGYFYLDLHPRDGKYSHAAVFGLQPQCHRSGKHEVSAQIAVAAMVANFSKPSASSPSLLRHQEVVTLFHEFGHVMHQLCSQVEYAKFSGTRVERDFVECPSQMLENWCWEAVPLAKLSCHVDDGSKIPDDLLQKLAASKTANAGLVEKRQILFGLFDQHIHSRAESDTRSVFAELQQNILGIPVTPGTNFAASFGHLAGGYDSQYYGYMWSSVYSCDMFASRFQNGYLMDPVVGADYRYMILAPGGSRDAIDSLKEFLGRDPNQTAFLEAKGLSV